MPFASGRVYLRARWILIVDHERWPPVGKLELTDQIVAAMCKRVCAPRRGAVAPGGAVTPPAQVIQQQRRRKRRSQPEQAVK